MLNSLLKGGDNSLREDGGFRHLLLFLCPAEAFPRPSLSSKEKICSKIQPVSLFKRYKRKNGGIRLYVLREIRSDKRAHE